MARDRPQLDRPDPARIDDVRSVWDEPSLFSRSRPDELVPAVLNEYGNITRKLLYQYLPVKEPRRYLYEPVADYPRRGGRALRPSLCIATARAFGGNLEAALRSAVAIELLHNALLIHDDIEDASETRRGSPTMHMLYGVPIAVNVGDALTMLSLRPLMDNRHTLGPVLAMRILEETERMAFESAEGQAMELGWRHDNTFAPKDDDYLVMVLKKTCWLTTIHPSRIGALIGTRDQIDLEPFIRFGFFLGAAFQIQDDLLNLIGEESRYGKEIDGDIWEGKRTLMLIRLFEEAGESERERLHQIFRKPRNERALEEVIWVRELMDTHGCIEYAQQIAHGLAGAALHEFSGIYGGLPPSRDKDFIEGLVRWVLSRA